MVQFGEFSKKALFRRFELGRQIDVDRVSATVDQGMLRIVRRRLDLRKVGMSPFPALEGSPGLALQIRSSSRMNCCRTPARMFCVSALANLAQTANWCLGGLHASLTIVRLV
jgi:hypothetical protein